MSEPFIAEIRIFAGNFAPRGWAFCDGDLLPISQNTALFSIIGTTYGGDGRTTTALPDLRGRAPLHAGRGPGLTERRLGQRGGVDTVTLTTQEIAGHSHPLSASSAEADRRTPTPGRSLAEAVGGSPYQSTTSGLVEMSQQSLPDAGGGEPHDNLQPYLAVSFIIALQGLYPSRS